MPGGTDAVIDGPFDSIYIRCWEEVPYVRNLRGLLRRLLNGEVEFHNLTVQDRICFPFRWDNL